MKKMIAFLSFLALVSAYAQEPFSLDECLQCALSRSRDVEQAGFSYDIAVQAYRQSGAAFIPDMVIRNSNTLLPGMDYEITAAVEAGAVLFAGFGREVQHRKAGMALRLGECDVENVRNMVSLNVVALYYKILQDKELVAIYKNRLELLESQEELISRKISLMAAVRSDLANVQADIASTKADILEAEGACNDGRISLCELLEIDDWRNFDVLPDSVIPTPYIACPYDFESMPQMRMAVMNACMAEYDTDIAKAGFWPTVQLGAGLSRQLKGNTDSFVSISIDIPVLSHFSTVREVRMRRLNQLQAQSKVTQTRLSLEREMNAAVAGIGNAYDRYAVLCEQQHIFEDIVNDTRKKYEYGVSTYFDCQTAMSNMVCAQSRLLQSKYDYLLKLRQLQILLDSCQ